MWLLIILLILLGVGGASAQDDIPLKASILHTNSEAYPQIDLFLSIFDRDALTPIHNLRASDFFIDTDEGQELTITNLSRERRPLDVVVLLDLTASVSPDELTNQAVAVVALANELDDEDRLGIVTTDGTTASIAAELQSDTDSVLRVLENLAPNEDTSGNVFWDGVHTGLAMLQGSSFDARQVLVVMTDVNNGSGTFTEEEAIALAVERDIEVYGLYFEFEEDGLPAGIPLLPPELSILTEATGGTALSIAGEEADDDYTDDRALPAMMQSIADLMLNEYHLTLSAAAPPTGQEQGLNITVSYEGSTMPPMRSSYRAGENPIQLTLPALTELQNISLPFTLTINAQSNAGPITRMTAYAVNEAGQRILLGEIAPPAQTIAIEQGIIPPGLFRLLVEAEDTVGNHNEADIFLNVVQSLAVTLFDVPTSVTTDDTITVMAQVSVPASVTAATFRVNDEDIEVRTLGPFDELIFNWQPPEAGEYELTVMVRDVLGNTAYKSAIVSVAAGTLTDEEDEGTSTLLVMVVAFIVGGSIAGLGGAGLIFWRMRGGSVPVMLATTVTPQPALEHVAPTVQKPISPDSEPDAPPIPEDSPIPEKSLAGDSVAELHGPRGERWPLVKGENTLGRHSSNSIQIKDESVSRYHARVEVVGQRCFYSDWQASHPSEINGMLLQAGKRHELSNGDSIRMGSSVLIFVGPE